MLQSHADLSSHCLDSLDGVIGEDIRLGGAGVDARRDGLDLWVDYEWDDRAETRAGTPHVRSFRRRARARATVAPWLGEGGRRERRALLIALAHIVGEMAGITGLGFRLLGSSFTGGGN